MKKLFLFLLIGAGIWGYFQGPAYFGFDEKVTPAASAAAKQTESTKLPDMILDSVIDIFQTLVAGAETETETPKAESAASVSTAPAPEYNPAADPIRAPKEDETMQDKVHDVFEFRKALEARIDRSAFVSLRNMSPLMPKAVIASEDRRFYEHGAIDLMGIGRAAVTNLITGETREGGSTIAQQTVKNIFLSEERTFTRKAEELALAVQLERNYTKDEILEIYLNTIYFGAGAYGIGQAAETYYHKKPADLTLSECATLAGLIPAPSVYNPQADKDAAAKRMTLVLMLMAKEGYITAKEASAATFDVLLK